MGHCWIDLLPRGLQLAPTTGACNGAVAKRMTSCRDLQVCALLGFSSSMYLINPQLSLSLLVLPSLLCKNCSRQSPGMLHLRCSCFVLQHLALLDLSHIIICWHTKANKMRPMPLDGMVCNIVLSVPCVPAGAVYQKLISGLVNVSNCPDNLRALLLGETSV